MGDLIRFPRKVEIPQLFSEGQFGITSNNIARAIVNDTNILIWFVNTKDNRAWDLQLSYATTADAENSLKELERLIRKMKFSIVDK